MTTVWIVDDDEEMVHAVGLMLRLLGCDSRDFLSAPLAAKKLLIGECPDVFILDLRMPGVSGIDFLKFLRSRPDFKNIPVVMLSTETSAMMVDRTMAFGANAYVTKPVALDELDAAIKKAMGVHGKI
jgi:two-component system chemotaxis response regulator CheY